MVKNWWRLLTWLKTSIVHRFVRNSCSNDIGQPRKPADNKIVMDIKLVSLYKNWKYIIYNGHMFHFCYFVDCILLTSGIILIDWHRMKSKDMQTRIVPRFASRCCLCVVSSLFVKFNDFFEFSRFGGAVWFSFNANIPFAWSLSKGWFVWDISPWYAPWKQKYAFYFSII